MKYLYQKGFTPIMFGGVILAQLLTVASYVGAIGLNLGLLGESLVWILGAAILFNESVLENGKDLGKLKLRPILSFVGFLGAAAYGLGIAFGMVDLVGVLSTYKVPLLLGVWILEIGEAFLKG